MPPGRRAWHVVRVLRGLGDLPRRAARRAPRTADDLAHRRQDAVLRRERCHAPAFPGRPALLAFGVTVVAPAPAQAAVECGLVVPSKVVIDAPQVEAPMRLTNGCYVNRADSADWELRLASSDRPVDDVVGLTGREFARTWSDDAPMGWWSWRPTAEGAMADDGQVLSQDWTRTEVKYAGTLTAAVTRTTGGLTWTATASPPGRS